MKTLIKSILLAGAIAAVVLLFAVRAVAPTLPRVVGRPAVEQTRSFSWPGAERFILVNDDGAVRVWSHADSDIAVEAVVRIYVANRGDSDAASEYAEALFDIMADEGEVRVVTEPVERPDLLEMRVDYDVFVPDGTDVEVVSANGNVHVASGCGCVSVQGRNADIYVKKPKGMVTARTTNGRINVVDAPDGAELRTVNGSIYAHVLGGKLTADTTNGLIVTHLRNAHVEGVELNSMNGGITVVMDERCSGIVDARTMHGGIRSDFAIDTSSGVQRRHHLRGDIGSGRALLNMQTLNGNIWLARGR
jgi:DUF4097 and DUF4098 domain-containing protein YvlB